MKNIWNFDSMPYDGGSHNHEWAEVDEGSEYTYCWVCNKKKKIKK